MNKKDPENISTKQILQLQNESDLITRRSPRMTRKSIIPVEVTTQTQTPNAKRIRLSREFKGLPAQSTTDSSIAKLENTDSSAKLESSEKITNDKDNECKVKVSDLKVDLSSSKHEEKSKLNNSYPKVNLDHKIKLIDTGKGTSESIKADNLSSSPLLRIKKIDDDVGKGEAHVKLNNKTASKIIDINDPNLDLSAALLKLCGGDKSLTEEMKSLPGIAYILIFTRAKRRENFITFDCVICNPLAGRILSGSGLTKHLRSRSHLLNILKMYNYSLFEEHKNSPETTLLKICNAFKSVGNEDGVVFVAADTYRNKRNEISQSVTEQFDQSKKIEEESKLSSDVLELAAIESEIFDSLEGFEDEDASEILNFNTFDKVVLITIPEYSIYMERFKSAKISVICVTAGSLNNIAAAIRCRKKFESKRTLWLTHPEVFRISQIENSDLCSACDKPLEIHSLPSTYKTALSAYVTEIQADFDALVKNVNSFLGLDSAFAILPPFPPAFLPLELTEHDKYHKSDKDRRNYYFASQSSLSEIKSLYAEFSKQMISFSLSGFKNLNLASHLIAKYMPVVRSWSSYIRVLTFKGDLQDSDEFINEKYDKWFKCVNKFITDSIAPLVDENLKSSPKEDCSEIKLINDKTKDAAESKSAADENKKESKAEDKEESKSDDKEDSESIEFESEEYEELEEVGENLSDILSDILGDIANGEESESDAMVLDSTAISKNDESLINSENYDQIVFICFCKAHAQLVPRDDKNAKNVSVVMVNSSLDWLEEKEKFNAVISRDFKTILFIVMGSITLLGKENKEPFCVRTNCTEPLLSVDLGSGVYRETVSAVIQKYKKFMLNLRTYLNMLFTHFILIPMLPVKCAPQNIITNRSSHDYFHKMVKNTNITFLTGGKDRWISFSHNFRTSDYTEMLKQGHGMLYEEDVFNSILKEIRETSKPPICWVKLSQNETSGSSDYNEEEYKLFLKSFINMSCLDDTDETKHLKDNLNDATMRGKKRKREKSIKNENSIVGAAGVADSINAANTEKNALVSASSTLGSTVSGNISLKILLPPYVTTSVIGPKGKVIAKIRKDSRAAIKFSSNREYYPRTMEQVGSLSGTLDAVLTALSLIMTIKERADLAQNSGAVSPDKKVQMVFAVTDINAARIIGKRGASIHRIKKESNAFVQVCPKPADFPLQETCFMVSSSDVTNCKTAFSLILSLIASDPLKVGINTSSASYTNTSTATNAEKIVTKQDSKISPVKKEATVSTLKTSSSITGSTAAGNLSFKILLPPYATTSVIGVNGKTIGKIRTETKTGIMFSSAREYYPGTTEQFGSLSGTVDAVLAAVTSILGIKEEADRTHSSDVSADKKVQIKFVVSDINAARIIGKHGARINRIKSESKALVQVCPKPANFSLQETCFLVSSSNIDNCKSALSMILTLVATDPPNLSTPNVTYPATKQDYRKTNMSSKESFSLWGRQNYGSNISGGSQQNYGYPAQSYNGYSTNSSLAVGGYRPSISQVVGNYSSGYRPSVRPLEVTGQYYSNNPSISQVLGEHSRTDKMGSAYSQDTRYQTSYQTQSSNRDISSPLRERLSSSWRSHSPRQRSPYSSQNLPSARGDMLRTRSRSRSMDYRTDRDREYRQKHEETHSKRDFNSSSMDVNFSLVGALNLLQRVCDKCGAMGRMTKDLAENIKSVLEKDRSKALKMIQQEDNNILFKMVVDKLKLLIPSSSFEEMTILSKAVEWTTRLAEYTEKSKEYEKKLNLKAIAKASLNKTPDFTVNLIKSAFMYEGKSNPTAEEISETYLAVSSLQCELMLEKN